LRLLSNSSFKNSIQLIIKELRALEELKKSIEELVKAELVRASKAHGDKFNSTHEGYAVILEELQEAEQELEALKVHLNQVWKNIRTDNEGGSLERMQLMRKRAILLVCEAVQVVAMNTKFMKLF
jgi:hypothetical protein